MLIVATRFHALPHDKAPGPTVNHITEYKPRDVKTAAVPFIQCHWPFMITITGYWIVWQKQHDERPID
jgi:hypothetical protein